MSNNIITRNVGYSVGISGCQDLTFYYCYSIPTLLRFWQDEKFPKRSKYLNFKGQMVYKLLKNIKSRPTALLWKWVFTEWNKKMKNQINEILVYNLVRLFWISVCCRLCCRMGLQVGTTILRASLRQFRGPIWGNSVGHIWDWFAEYINFMWNAAWPVHSQSFVTIRLMSMSTFPCSYEVTSLTTPQP